MDLQIVIHMQYAKSDADIKLSYADQHNCASYYGNAASQMAFIDTTDS